MRIKGEIAVMHGMKLCRGSGVTAPLFLHLDVAWSSVSQPPGRGPVPDPGINYTGPREVLLEFVILVF